MGRDRFPAREIAIALAPRSLSGFSERSA